jgi:hypothetical protein
MGTLGTNIAQALQDYNHTQGRAWTLGTNWSSVGTEFETFINKFLFPKLNETALIQAALGNSFEWLAKEVDFVGQYSEEYVIRDTIPTTMDLSKDEALMLKRNYPQMITKLYGPGIMRKMKFTLNNNDQRMNFAKLSDGVKYAIGVYKKKISDINVDEERQIKAMLVDYAENVTPAKARRSATSEEDLFNKIAEALMNLQNNSDKYNEARLASGGAIARYTTVSKLSKIAILTTDAMKAYLLNTKLANTFASEGIDISKRIISFEDLGGAFRAIEDTTLSAAAVQAFRELGDYQTTATDIIPKGSVVTFDVNEFLPAEDAAKFEEIKPSSDLWAYIFDLDAIKYNRYTKGMLKEPFYNPEFDEVTHWIHYYSMKAISPFYNKILITGPSAD